MLFFSNAVIVVRVALCNDLLSSFNTALNTTNTTTPHPPSTPPAHICTSSFWPTYTRTFIATAVAAEVIVFFCLFCFLPVSVYSPSPNTDTDHHPKPDASAVNPNGRPRGGRSRSHKAGKNRLLWRTGDATVRTGARSK